MTDYKKWAELEKEIPDDEEDIALKKLREQKDNMSEKEVRRLHECWEKPEFKQMFQEYAEEVSDPKHKAEQEAYLQQVEQEQRAERDAKNGFLNGRSPGSVERLGDCVPGQPEGPSGSQLITPNRGFVVKTWKRAPGRKDFDRELGKVFINVCTHDEIDRPTSQVVTAPDGRKGESWSMPHLVSPKLKEEKDKSGHMATVIDLCFHTEVLQRTEAPHGMGERWKEMVAKTAIEMCGKLHSLDLDPQFKLLKMKYFGDEKVGPSTMSWRPDSAFNDSDAENTPPATGTGTAASAAHSGALPSTPSPASQQETPKQPASTSAESARSSGTAKVAAKTAAGSVASNGIISARRRTKEPKHSVVHRGVGDMAASWSDSKLTSSGRPRELLVRIELPELSSAAEIDLDITERKLDLKHEGAGYVLALTLPYPVIGEQGSAKFDKAKKTLTVTLPVLAEVSPMPQWAPPSAGQTDEEREAELAREKAEEAEAARQKAEADAARQKEEREARLARAKQEEEERQARIHAAQVQADKEAARRARLAGKPKPPSTAVPTAPPAVPPAAPPPSAPPPTAPSPAAPPPAAPLPTAPPTAKTAEDASAEWVVVPRNEAAEAKAATAAAEAASGAPKAVATPSVPAAATPAAPSATKGLPAFSNGLLFELD